MLNLTRPALLLVTLLLACPFLGAAPAPWYYWSHTSGGPLVCAQHAPGPGWTAHSPPFAGPGCQRPLPPAQP